MTPTIEEDSTSVQWKATSKRYSEQMAQQNKLTSLYADDLITLLIAQPHDLFVNAKTILDVGCGTGVFVQAYIKQFPNGIVGQTIISTDISPSMIEQAQQSIDAILAAAGTNTKETTFATKLIYQLEDGTQLDGITDHSIDIVASLYGVFLIPDQNSTLQSIRRVLKPNTGVFANAAWTKHDGIQPSFGGNLQDVFFQMGSTVKEMIASGKPSTPTHTPTTSGESSNNPSLVPSFLEWVEPTKIASNLTQQGFHQQKIRTYRMFHSIVCSSFLTLFHMCLENPMINAKAANLSKEQLNRLLSIFYDACQIQPYNDEDRDRVMILDDVDSTTGKSSGSAQQQLPFTLWTASNLTISHVV